MAKLIKLIDTSRCTACRGCQVACKNWNRNPAGKIEPFKGNYQTRKDTNAVTYTIVKMDEYVDPVKGLQWLFRKHQCMHCENPACMDVCPRQAYSKTDWGATIHDPDRCIGCQYCTYACPWHVPKYFKKEDIVTKCTLCADRVQAGLGKGAFKDYPLEGWPEGGTDGFPASGTPRELATYVPACVKTCPAGALAFGDRDKLMARAEARVAKLVEEGYRDANIYGRSEMGGLSVVYILSFKPEVYGLPAEPKVPGQIAAWKNIIQPYFGWLIPLALGASALSFVTTRLLKKAEEISPEEGGNE